jgi:hypothetical protein
VHTPRQTSENGKRDGSLAPRPPIVCPKTGVRYPVSLEADCIRWSYAKLPAALQKGDENLLAQLKGQSNQADVTTQRRGALAY